MPARPRSRPRDNTMLYAGLGLLGLGVVWFWWRARGASGTGELPFYGIVPATTSPGASSSFPQLQPKQPSPSPSPGGGDTGGANPPPATDSVIVENTQWPGRTFAQLPPAFQQIYNWGLAPPPGYDIGPTYFDVWGFAPNADTTTIVADATARRDAQRAAADAYVKAHPLPNLSGAPTPPMGGGMVNNPNGSVSVTDQAGRVLWTSPVPA